MVNNRNCTRPSSRRAMLLFAAMFVLAPLVGCGDGIERVQMSGKVTYAGQPVEEGLIRFMPAPGTEAPLTVEVIKAGHYQTGTTCKGVPVGSYQVSIRAYNPDDPIPTGPDMPQRKQLLPPKYNIRSELKITLEPGQGKLEKDFILIQ